MIQISLRSAHFDVLKDIVAELNQALDAELETASKAIGARAHGEAKRLIQTEIYDVPIPLTGRADRKLGKSSKVRSQTTKGQHGKWSRGRGIKNGENFAVERRNGRWAAVLYNNANHAAARNALGAEPELNRAGRRAGVQRDQSDLPPEQRSRTRSVQWQRQAVKRLEPWIRDQYLAAVQRALRKRRR